jgi:AraC family transcriptional regulator, transcriptional activator FtrA
VVVLLQVGAIGMLINIMPNTRTSLTGPLVAVLAYDGLCTFEFAISYEVFGLPRPEMGADWYRYSVCAIEDGPLRAAGGLVIEATASRRVLSKADIIIVPGWRGIDAPVPTALIKDLVRAHARGARIMSLCSGIAVLAAAGLLEGRRATTHWRYASSIGSRFPGIKLEPDMLYVDEKDVLTAAGSAAGIDLCLHVVRKEYGSRAANNVARRLVVPPHREGGQVQFIQRPVLEQRENSRLGALIDWLRGHLNEVHSIDKLAGRAGMSSRTFQRKFQEATGLPPGEWLVSERVRLAQDHLERDSNASLKQIVEVCGFGSVETMRHHFRRKTGIAPVAYQRQFSPNPKYDTADAEF